MAILVVVLDGAHRASLKVCAIFKRRLLFLYVEEKNEIYKEQLLRFIQVMSAGTHSINLGGFLTCDRSLLTALFNAVLTYLVVLLQLQGQPTPPASAGFNNDTATAVRASGH
ncbi:gustatory and odorant receptor 24-like [Bacillus rossius redtenbacheri]|uniref:gustatory and odorant receptor 24-like n=1 Tax=Bacillus rossius redtenbacheri TaxID=93214 RepID=UPI002FDD1979